MFQQQLQTNIIRQSVMIRNKELKDKLKSSQDTLLDFIPEEQRKAFEITNFKQRVVELPKQEDVTPGEKILELEQENIEIRTIIESDSQYGVVPVKKEYIVHKVDPKKDTLFQLSYKYKIPKHVI